MGFLDLFRRQAPAATPSAPVLSASDAGLQARGSDGLANLVAGLGTERDKRYYSTYGYVSRMTQYQLEALYEGSWLGGKIVDIPAGDMTRQWVARTWDGAKDDQRRRKDLAVAEAALDVRGKVKLALTWARLHGGSVIVLAIAGDLDVAQPLDVTRIRKGSLRNLLVMDRWRLTASTELDTDLNSPNFGQSLYYTVNETAARIHWTRVIRFDGVTLPHGQWLQNGRWNGSVLQRVADSIKNYDGARDIASSMMYEACVDVLRIADLYALLSQPGGDALVASRFQSAMLMKGINRSLVIDKNDEYDKKQMTFGGVVDIIRHAAVDVAGAADIPVTRLFGQSPAGMDATGKSDTDNYDDKIKADQESQLRPRLERIDAVLLPSVFGSMPEDYELSFNPLRQMSDSEQADLENKRATRDKTYVDMGALKAGAVTRELLQEATYHTLTQEDVDLAEEDDEAKADRRENVLQFIPGGRQPAAKQLPPAEGDADETDAGEGLAAASDALPGDKIEHKEDGWHVYAAGKHIGGPYKTRAKAMRTLRRHEKYDRR
jgi:phage-related protein (TIGR01555 family)